MNHTALVFPGFHALVERGARRELLRLPHVRSHWDQTLAQLGHRPGLQTFARALAGDDRAVLARREHLLWSALLTLAIQVGTAAHLRERHGDPAWVCGFSLGDVARTIHAGCGRFADALAVADALPETWTWTGGRSRGCVLPRGTRASPVDLAALRGLGVTVCRLSHRMLHAAGGPDALARLRAFARARGWHTVALADCPLHAPALAPLATRLTGPAHAARLDTPRVPLFSSVRLRRLDDPDAVRAELLANVTEPYDWCAAAETLVAQHGVRRFVEIGPGRVATRMVRDMGLPVAAYQAIDLLRR